MTAAINRPRRVVEVVDTTGVRYPLGECIGKGGYGKVYVSEGCVLKINCRRATLGESLVFTEKLKHPNVGRILGVVVLIPYFFQGVRMGRAAGKELMDLATKLNPSESLKVVRGLAEGVSYLNGRGFVHRDIKPENVVVDANAIAVLLDFGGLCEEGSSVGREGTLPYMPPEVIGVLMHLASRGIDSWSFGVTVLAIFTGMLVSSQEEGVAHAVSAAHSVGKILSERAATLLTVGTCRRSVKWFLDAFF
ncbi:protein kinase [Pirellulaceae bacterium]|nr:protein kinase [Pirellulaceae bacterium]